ncbi:MAG: right-handed parallel beta-helix repeat-containing protein [Candidatus Latescibacterota bacterium]|nr:MAG: right-handed parallel beta-helix repeat-containing protein [Candidatus Latescibacterota bacterium]
MSHKSLYYLALCALCTALPGVFGCEDTVKYLNEAPSELKITAEKCFVAGSAIVRLVGTATDADGDSLTFRWTASSGSFPAGAANDTVYWKAPSAPGAATITMSVTDEIDTRSLQQTITVCELLPAQVIVSRTIANAGHIYITRGDAPMRVAGGVTLTIEPGVTIVMDRTLGGIESYGRIVAAGTPSQKIFLRGNTCSSETAMWTGIYLIDATGEGIFRNCEITAGMDGVTARDGATLDIKDCQIYNHYDFGVNVLYGATATIRNCSIWDNGDGIYVDDASAEIRRCSIRYSDGDGLLFAASQDAVQASIESCVVANNYKNGFVIADRAAPAIHYCSIFANSEAGEGTYAVRLSANASPEPIRAENNYWGLGNDTEEEIAAIIYDAVDNPGAIFAYVSFIPWLVEAPAARHPMAAGATGRSWAR